MGNDLPPANVPESGSAPPPLPQRVPLRERDAAGDVRPPLAVALGAPRLFALVVDEPAVDGSATADLVDVDTEAEAHTRPEAPGRPGEAFAWGMEFPNGAVIYLCKRGGGRSELGVFQSAESARLLFSILGELRVVYV